jgi:hypothetical protein
MCGGRRLKMTKQGKDEKRASASDRRDSKMDRRQFIDIGWMMEDERRVSLTDRRLVSKDRRV